MDTASTLMGLGLLILFVAPVGYLLYNQTFQDKKRVQKFAFLTLQNGYRLDETEHLNGLSLGLDKTAKKFLLLKSGGEAKLQVLDLEYLGKIEIHNLDEDGLATSILDEIREIALQVNRKDSSVIKVIFYAEEEDPVTQKEQRLEKAQKWKKILQQDLK